MSEANQSVDGTNKTGDPERDCRLNEYNLSFKIVSPFVLLLGLYGNVMILIAIHRQRKGFVKFFRYFKALAVSDSLLLLCSLFPQWVESLAQVRFEVEYNIMCKVDVFLFYFFLIYSSWLLVAMTVQVTAAVVCPFSTRAASTSPRRTSTAVICALFLGSGLASSTAFVPDSLDYTGCYWGSNDELRYKNNLVGKLSTWLHFLLVFVLPYFIMSVGNCVLIIRLKASQLKVQSTSTTLSESRSPRPRHSMRPRRQKRQPLTLTLIATSVAFCVFLLPISLTELFVISEWVSFCDISAVARYYLLMLLFLNAAAKFYIYCLTGSVFRRQLKKMMPCCMKSTDVEPPLISGHRTDAGKSTNAASIIVL